MASSPYRDAANGLGASLAVYRSSAMVHVRPVVVSLGLLVIAGAASVSAVEEFNNRLNPRVSSAVVGFVFSGLCVVAAVFGFFGIVRSKKTRITCHEHGITAETAGRQTTVLWRNLRELRFTAARRPASELTLISNDGGRLAIGNDVARYVALCATISREVASRIIPEMFERLDAGESIAFGPFVVSPDGVRHEADTLLWHEVEHAVLVRGVVAVGSRSEPIRLMVKRDGVFAWARAPLSEVPNPGVFVGIVEVLRKKRGGKAAKS